MRFLSTVPAGGAFAAALALSSPLLAQQTLQVEHAAGHLVELRLGGYVLEPHHLVTGSSVGQTDYTDQGGSAVIAADDLYLGSYFARGTSSDPTWEVDLGTWYESNGVRADFFLFEVGGNDAVAVRPRFADGSLGGSLPLSGWTPSGFDVPVGPNAGQPVYGLHFHMQDLRDAAGAPLSGNETLAGLVFSSPSIDAAVLCAVDPDGSPAPGQDGGGALELRGQRTAWHPVELWLHGPWASEIDDAPNPFLDYRMQVRFEGPGGASLEVPGFFGGNGRGLGEGRIWKARLAAPVGGVWRATVSFRQGTDVAVSTSPSAGAPTAWDGRQVEFLVRKRDPEAEGFLRWGLLEHVGEHYLKFRDGPYWIKGGTDSPENLLGYQGFDDSQYCNCQSLGLVHAYEPHRQDWQPGDVEFRSNVTGVDARGLVGALNYLSQERVNSVYFLPMNLGGDARDTAPFVGWENTPFVKTHYDVSRLFQWNQVFEHAQRRGIALQVVLAETEIANETWLDGGGFGVERKLFFRELVARFAHVLALKWNLSEENDFSVSLLREFADYIGALDAYDHPVTFHNHPNDLSDYQAVAGEPRFTATSLQYDPNLAGQQVETVRAMSAAAGHPWVVDMDENNPWYEGLSDTNAVDLRKRALYDILFSGGNLEWYGGDHPQPVGGDQSIEDFRSREEMWRYTWYARDLLQRTTPFWRMEPADSLLSGESGDYGGGEVFALPGRVYAIYLPATHSTGTLDLTGHPGRFYRSWYDPRTGLFVGRADTLNGGGPVALGPPPANVGEDWVCLLRRRPARVNATLDGTTP